MRGSVSSLVVLLNGCALNFLVVNCTVIGQAGSTDLVSCKASQCKLQMVRGGSVQLEIRAGFVASAMGMEEEGQWAVAIFHNNSPLAQVVGTFLEVFFFLS